MRCLHYNGFHEAGDGVSMLSGMYDMDEIKIKKWGKSRNWCPYYLIRMAISDQFVVDCDDDNRDGSRWGV